MNAADPASPAGLAAIQDIIAANCASFAGTAAGAKLRRVPSSRLCFRGAELLAISNRGGRELEIFIPSDDPDLAEALAFVKDPRTRAGQPENKIAIEKINGKTAGGSAYAPFLNELGFVKDRGRLILY
jgi:hypothetical protein